MTDIWVERKRGVEREKRFIFDSGKGENGTSDDSNKCFVEGEREKQKTKKILEQRDEVGVDEVDSRGDGEVLRDNLLATVLAFCSWDFQ